MTTTISYKLIFSREAGEHPFLVITTCIFNDKNRLMHSHSATIGGEYDFQRRELLTSWRNFKEEKADSTDIFYNHGPYGKSITITKFWS